MKTVIVIPSRLASTRFPNKPLAKIAGREMILRVCDRASVTRLPVYVATPDVEIVDLVERNGYKSILTTDCATGTDRVAQAVELIDADIVINVQGDEPLVRPSDIMQLERAKIENMDSVIGTVRVLEYDNDNVVKVFIGDGNELLYMTRTGQSGLAQCGLYAFSKEELRRFYMIGQREKLVLLKKYDHIELMRCKDLGLPVKMILITGSQAVDVIDDIRKIEPEFFGGI